MTSLVHQQLSETQNVAGSRPHIVTVDFIRGLCACAVMAYHLLFFDGIVQVERVAYYAVYAFFVVSGFSLYVTYRDRLRDSAELRAYFIRRYFRIAPLFYFCLCIRLLVSPLPPDCLYRLLLNLTLTFGAANPGDTSLVGGGWSIGIEVFYYVIFPLLIFAANKSLSRLLAITFLAILIMILFANVTLRGHTSMIEGNVWSEYTQPVAFFGYFSAGLLLGESYLRWPEWKGGSNAPVLVIIGLLPFLFVRTDTTLQLITGRTGIVLLVSTIAIVAGAAFCREPRGKLRSFAVWIGLMSYPIYLLHPLMYILVSRLIANSGWLRISSTIVLTVGVALVVSRYIEQPARAFGRRRSVALE